MTKKHASLSTFLTLNVTINQYDIVHVCVCVCVCYEVMLVLFVNKQWVNSLLWIGKHKNELINGVLSFFFCVWYVLYGFPESK